MSVLSTVTPLGELDLFENIVTQDSIIEDVETYHRPRATEDISKPIVFEFTAGRQEYLRLNESELYLKVKVKIKKNNGTISAGSATQSGDWSKISIVNNLAHSLFKFAQLEINGKHLVSAPQTYHFKSYFETLMGFTNDAKESHLTAQGWFDDTSDFEIRTAINSKRTALIMPDTATDAEGRTLALMCKLHFDLSMQGKALIGGCNIRITLYPNDVSFYLKSSDENLVPSLELVEAGMYVHRAIVSPQIIEAQEAALTKSNARYLINRGECYNFTIESGKTDVNLYNIINGVMPRQIFVAFVDAEDYLGNFKTNPFQFKHNNIIEISCFLNGIQYPRIAYKTDFTNDDYVRAYIALTSAVNQNSTDSTCVISRSMYKNGFTLFPFVFTPDLAESAFKSGYISRPQAGSLSLHVRFKNALTKSIIAVVYAEYDSVIEIDAERNVFTDYL